jgi:hypothetical protein
LPPQIAAWLPFLLFIQQLVRRQYIRYGNQIWEDVPVIGFDAIVRVTAGSMLTRTAEVAFLLRFSNRG